MSRRIQRVKGTRDLLPPETAVWAALERTARDVFARYGYAEIRTPVLESTELFVRGVGEGTDIVGKEMYTFADRKGRSLTLRPESTASVVRAYLENGLDRWPSPVKLFYIGPQFRNERPQKGRYRQFFQIGAELLGDEGPTSDGEVLLMLTRLLRELGFEGVTVLLNTLGDEASRQAYREALAAFLEPLTEQLHADSRRRLEINPLRILDTKIPAERELLVDAPRLADQLNEESRSHFDGLRRLLDRFEVDYRVDDRLVRGLDYYTHTVFEIVDESLGAQNALCGGGRYDRLVSDLGGPRVPALGFAIGEDRLVSALPESFRRAQDSSPPIVVAGLGEGASAEALAVAEELREEGLVAEADLAGRSLKAMLKRADRLGAAVLVLIGEDELESGTVALRNLATREQTTLPRAELASILKATEKTR